MEVITNKEVRPTDPEAPSYRDVLMHNTKQEEKEVVIQTGSADNKSLDSEIEVRKSEQPINKVPDSPQPGFFSSITSAFSYLGEKLGFTYPNITTDEESTSTK